MTKNSIQIDFQEKYKKVKSIVEISVNDIKKKNSLFLDAGGGKKSVIEFKNGLYFIFKVRRASRPFFTSAYLLSKPIRIAATRRPTKPFSPSVETTPRSPSRTSLKNATLPPNTIPATTPKPTTPIKSDVRSDTIPLSVSIARIIIPPY